MFCLPPVSHLRLGQLLGGVQHLLLGDKTVIVPVHQPEGHLGLVLLLGLLLLLRGLQHGHDLSLAAAAVKNRLRESKKTGPTNPINRLAEWKTDCGRKCR